MLPTHLTCLTIGQGPCGDPLGGARVSILFVAIAQGPPCRPPTTFVREVTGPSVPGSRRPRGREAALGLSNSRSDRREVEGPAMALLGSSTDRR